MDAIKTTSLTKYYGNSKGIEDMNLTVKQGDFFGFIGPNGAGKSTTIRTLLGLISPTRGNAMVLGMNIERQQKDILSHVGYMPSEASFYRNMRVKDVIKFSADLRHRDCSKEAGYLCERLELDTNKKIWELSLGNRKKVSIICALQHNPELCILDEPTSGLDPAGAVLFRKIIEKEREKGTTIFLTTHNMSDADLLCDRGAFISNGNIAALDTPKHLKEKHSNRSIIIDYLYQGRREEQTIEAPDMKAGIPFVYDELISVHSQEPTLEDIFIQYTGRGLT